MADPLNPYQTPVKISVGEWEHNYASIVADWLRMKIGIDLTEKEQDALAVLIGGIHRRLFN